MSNSLVHKSLELLGYEKDLQKEQRKKRKRKDIGYKGALDLIPTKHRIVSNDKTDLGTILDRSSRTTVYEIQKRLATQEDPIDENVQRLLLLSGTRIKPGTANNLLQRAVGKRYIEQEKPKESEETAFTEEDFKKFEQEYVE